MTKAKRSINLKTLTVFVALFLLLFNCNFTHAETRTIDELRNSVVRIICYGMDGGTYTGTGFAVGKSEPVRYIVTNYHVVEPNLEGVTILLSKEDQIAATVIAFDRVKDLAVLELAQELYKRPPMELGNSDEVKPSQGVFALGFPGDADLIDDTPSGDPDDVSITRGIISKISTQGGRGIFQIDVAINPGNSGGPLLNESGQVIGINTFGVLSASGINGAVRVDELLPILESRGIEYLTGMTELSVTDPVKVETKSSSRLILVGIIGAGLFILLIVVVLLVVVLRKKGNKQNADQQRTPASYQTTKPVLKGLSGYFIGQTIDLDQSYLTIGRDALQCQLVYPASTEEISRRHCTIQFNSISQTFTIEDYSSNGTFLQTGERVPQGKVIQLRPGDRFYLSSKENMFEVTWEKR